MIPREAIEPFLLEIATKETPDGTIYTCIPKRGVNTLPTGYFKSENDAVVAFYNALKIKNRI